MKQYSECPAAFCLSHFSGRWKIQLIELIQNQINRFGAMRRALPKISKQTLSRQLRELERCGILLREVQEDRQRKVIYSLTERGESLLPILDAMKQWGEEHLSHHSMDELMLKAGSTEHSLGSADQVGVLLANDLEA